MIEEKFPVSESLNVIQGTTIYKTGKWWLAVVLLETFGRKQIATYLWNNKNGVWKRRQKFMIQNETTWRQITEAVEKLLPKLK